MKKKYWYAVQYAGDSDWGYGFDTIEEAQKEMMENGGDLIAVIHIGWIDDDGTETECDPICVEEIWRDDETEEAWSKQFEYHEEDDNDPEGYEHFWGN